MSANYVKRQIIDSIGGNPILREELTTDNGNLILDIHELEIDDPQNLENCLNNIVGVVTNGLFANRGADILLLGSQNGVIIKHAK
jgi:ribose 5-phosphate isomerase A